MANTKITIAINSVEQNGDAVADSAVQLLKDNGKADASKSVVFRDQSGKAIAVIIDVPGASVADRDQIGALSGVSKAQLQPPTMTLLDMAGLSPDGLDAASLPSLEVVIAFAALAGDVKGTLGSLLGAIYSDGEINENVEEATVVQISNVSAIPDTVTPVPGLYAFDGTNVMLGDETPFSAGDKVVLAVGWQQVGLALSDRGMTVLSTAAGSVTFDPAEWDRPQWPGDGAPLLAQVAINDALGTPVTLEGAAPIQLAIADVYIGDVAATGVRTVLGDYIGVDFVIPPPLVFGTVLPELARTLFQAYAVRTVDNSALTRMVQATANSPLTQAGVSTPPLLSYEAALSQLPG